MNSAWHLLIPLVFSFSSEALAIGDFGPDTCMEGFVWREACGPQDHVCVVPQIRTQAQEDNALANSRIQPGGGAFGPNTCLSGFVWRDAQITRCWEKRRLVELS